MIKYEDILRVNSEIKKIDIKGKLYADVPQKIQAFRKLFPMGRILTEILSLEDGVCVMKSTAYDENGNVLATGHAYEREDSSYINKTSYIENCETSATGRALSQLGLGSEASIASLEELLNAMNNQKTEAEKESGKPKGRLSKKKEAEEITAPLVTRDMLRKLREYADKVGYRESAEKQLDMWLSSEGTISLTNHNRLMEWLKAKEKTND